jgi:TonB family protein
MSGILSTFGKSLALVAGLAPTMAAAHCCCDGHRHHVSYHRVVEHWDSERFQVTAGRPCNNYPASAARLQATGVTWVKLHVDGDGFVEAARISDSSGRTDLDRAALACVTGWHLQAGYEWRVAKIAWRWHWVSSWG